MSTGEQAERQPTAAYIAKHPVFEIGHMAAELALRGGVRAAHERAKHHMQQGRLVRVARGIYASVPAGIDPSSFVPDKFLVARAAREDAVFCYHSALELHGVAQSHWSDCTVFTAKRRSSISLGAGAVHFLSIPSAIGKGHGSFGEALVQRSGQSLRIAGPERTLVEGFRRPDRAGGVEEHIDSCSALGVLGVDLLFKVLARYGERRLWSAVGWFLERHQEQFFVTDDHLRKAESRASNSPIYLDRKERGGKLMSRWSLIVPDMLTSGMEGDRG